MLDQAIYRIRDPAVVRALVSEHSWVTLVSDPPTGLVVSHLPVLVDDAVAVVGHLARPDADEHELGRHPAVPVVEGLEADPVPANRSLADRRRADGVLP